MRAALYGRVSTSDKGQDPELQLRPLRDYCTARGLQIAGEYIDIGQSGSKDRRPELDRLLDTARKRQIDFIIVWKLDRFGRSLKHLVTVLDELNSLGVGFVSWTENIDLSTASGRLMFHIIGAMAEFERELIKERVRAGISNARAKGKQHGRKPVPAEQVRKVIAQYEEDPALSIAAIAGRTKMKKATVGKIVKGYKEGSYDRDGFRYESPLVPVYKTPSKSAKTKQASTRV